MMNYNIAVISGDGIGPEVIQATLRVLECAVKNTDIRLHFTHYLADNCAIDKTGHPLPEETLSAAKASDAVLLGAVGGDKWDGMPSGKRPENALLDLRAQLRLFANLRPAVLHRQ